MDTQSGQNSIVTFTDTEVNVSFHSVADAKRVLKELKLKKKEYALAKRDISQRQKLIRAEYTDTVRRRGSKFRGGGSLGSFIRTVQTFSRDAERSALAQELAPLERQKNSVDAIINEIDKVILQVESYIVENS